MSTWFTARRGDASATTKTFLAPAGLSTRQTGVEVSVEAISWVLHEAAGCPPRLVSTLIGLANHADPLGRGAYPGQGMLASYTRKSERQVRRDLAEAERLGLIRRGDQMLVAHIPADRRPVVWDLAMGPATRPVDPESDLDGGTSTSGRTSATGQERPADAPETPVDNATDDLDGGTSMSAPGGHPRPLAGGHPRPTNRKREPSEEPREETRVLAVGDTARRNARAAAAPPAKPRRSRSRFGAASQVLAQLPRYRGPGVGVRYRFVLAALARQALADGYGPDAIVYYARMVISEAIFREHQHVPEFREALRRLRRDADLGHACRTCGDDPAICACAWTWDQGITADPEAALRAAAGLGATPEERAACLAAARTEAA
jgi:hypothetical protein